MAKMSMKTMCNVITIWAAGVAKEMYVNTICAVSNAITLSPEAVGTRWFTSLWFNQDHLCSSGTHEKGNSTLLWHFAGTLWGLALNQSLLLDTQTVHHHLSCLWAPQLTYQVVSTGIVQAVQGAFFYSRQRTTTSRPCSTFYTVTLRTHGQDRGYDTCTADYVATGINTYIG